MSKLTPIWLSIVPMIAWSTSAGAYDPGTHRQITLQAIQASTLGDANGVLSDVGLVLVDPNPSHLFVNTQPNINDVPLGPGHSNFFVDQSPLTVQDLILTGSVLEDEGYRSFCHFYDPTQGHTHPLNLFGVTATYSAPEWATGMTDSGSAASGECEMSLFGVIGLLGNETQSYSLTNANDYFYKALTLPNKSDRDQNFSNLFLSVGHVVHLLEDMAQPQHVRNDLHCDLWECGLIGQYSPSKYERFSTLRTTAALPGGFPVVAFDASTETAREFWSGHGSGLAEFTNQNFVSFGTISDFEPGNSSPNYQLPVWDGGISSPEPVDQVYNDVSENEPDTVKAQCPKTSPCFVQFLSSTTYDNYTQQYISNPKAVSYSVFDMDLDAIHSHRVYALNDANYLQAFNTLIPRAIGYSAGLMNYFFRGRFEVNFDPNNLNTSTQTNFLVTNQSGVDLSSGDLTLYYDASNGTRYPVTAATQVNGNPLTQLKFPAGDTLQVAVPLPLPHPAANPGEFMFVYKGTVGTEPGVAAKYYKPNDDLNVLVRGYNATPQFYGYDAVETFDSQGNQKLNSPQLLGGETFCAGVPAYASESCWPPESMVIYNKTRYVGRPQWGVDSEGVGGQGNIIRYSLALSSDGIDLNNPVSYQQCITNVSNAVAGVAVDNTSLYVLVNRGPYAGGYGPQAPCPFGPAGVYVDTFDHQGNFQKATLVPGLPATVIGSNLTSAVAVSANNSHICVVAETSIYNASGGYSFIGNLAVLTDTQLSSSVTLETDNPFACSSTSDRHYVLHDGGLKSYDNSGALVVNISLPQVSASAASKVAAIDNTVYVTASGLDSNGDGNTIVTVYEFHRQTSGGVETLVPVRNFLVKNTPVGWSYNSVPAISVDTFQSINYPTQ